MQILEWRCHEKYTAPVGSRQGHSHPENTAAAEKGSEGHKKAQSGQSREYLGKDSKEWVAFEGCVRFDNGSLCDRLWVFKEFGEGTDLLGFVDLGDLGEESRLSLGLAIKRMEFSWE